MAIGPSVRGATRGAQSGDEQDEIGDVTRGSGSNVERSARGAAFKHVAAAAAASRMVSVFRRGRV